VFLNRRDMGGLPLSGGLYGGTLTEQRKPPTYPYIGVVEILSNISTPPTAIAKDIRCGSPITRRKSPAPMELPHAEVGEHPPWPAFSHDIGQDRDIVGKSSTKAADLTDEEKRIMGQHAKKGARILASVGGVLKDAIRIVLFHHRYFVEKSDKEEKRCRSERGSSRSRFFRTPW